MKQAVIMCGLLLAVAASAAAAADPVVARIGDRTFTTGDLQRWIGYGAPSGQAAPEAAPQEKAAMLRSIVTAMAIADRARAEKFDLRPDVRESLQLVTNNFLTVQYLDKVVAAGVTVTEDEVQRAYAERKEQLLQPEQVRARHLLVRVERTAPDAERAAARAKVEAIRARLAAGEDFARLAEELSEDPGSRGKGGDLGFFPRGRMLPEFEEAAFALEPGALSDVVETDYGFHLLRVEEKRAPALQPYAEVSGALRTMLTLDKKTQAVDAYVEQLVKEQKIGFTLDPLFGAGPHGQ
jgi:peptidyl-prolyl cis-trans isomerase C